MGNKKSPYLHLSWMSILFAVCIVGSISMGRYAIDPITIIRVLLSKVFPIDATWSSQVQTVIFQVRLPRVLMGCLIGTGLGCAGYAFQSIFQNPLVSPDVLGASNGAGFGAALGILLGMGYQGISLCAFLCGLFSVSIVGLVAARVKWNPVLGLVLAGIMVSSLASAGVSYLKLIADTTDQLPAITYWLMGSLASVREQDVLFAAPLIIAGMIPAFLLRWQINVLTMGDEEARTMGIHPKRLRCIIVLSATLTSAACVSVSGMIGWVGLVIPHFSRMIVGNDSRVSLPAAALLGGSFLLVVDDFARLLTTSEIPIGILTAFVGAPFFLFLLVREGSKI